MKQVVIIGAGISGLATAYHVVRSAEQRGITVRVTVLESTDRPGGRVWTKRIDGYQIELGASSFLESKRSTLELCDQIGLSSELIKARPEAANRYISRDHQLFPLPATARQFVSSRLLSWRGKVRLLCERWVRTHSTQPDESVHEFACRRIGHEAAEILIDAMVTGIHAGDSKLLSVAAAFPRMIELERDYGSLFRALAAIRKSRAQAAQTEPASAGAGNSRQAVSPGPGGAPWSLRRGMGQLIERLAETRGIELTRGTPVERISTNPDGRWTAFATPTQNWTADAVVLACPSFTQAAIVESIDPDLARLLGEIRYNSVTVVALGYRRTDVTHALDGFGYLIPQTTRRDVLGVLWNSTIFEGRAPDGMVLLQAMSGGWNRPEIVGWNDERVVRAVLGELSATMNLSASPAFIDVIRWPQAIPQYHLGHLDRVAAIESRAAGWPGLHLTGNSLRGISVNDCTENALRCANAVVRDLKA